MCACVFKAIWDLLHCLEPGFSQLMLSSAPLVKASLLTLRTFLQYCHYVAGLVGIGLSRLFSASELEDPLIGEDTERANSMGLFLQKTNIIRDYLEDQREGREFWPQEVTASGGLGRILNALWQQTIKSCWLQVTETQIKVP